MQPEGSPRFAADGAPLTGRSETLLATVAACWALLFGMSVVMLGNGLQGSLLGLRATMEGFPTAVTGLVMSGYFAGFAAGSTLAPKLVARVGHIRVFAALASLASIAALAHILWIEPVAWGLMRLVTGFSFAGLYVVAESWLNDRAGNERRGQLLSVYMVLMLSGMAIGPLLLNLADPGGVILFVLASVLVSFALIPVLLTTGSAPRFDAPAKLRVRELFRVSPLGMATAIAVGLSNGALVGMGAVYAEAIGLSVAQISFFMGIAVLGGVILQWPVGALSDALDRRMVLTVVTFTAGLAALAAIPVSGDSVIGLLAIACLFGGLSFPMYSLGLAHANDRLEPDQMVAASSGLVLVAGVAAALGPLSAATMMSAFGPDGFFVFLAAVHVVVGLFALYRMTRRSSLPLEKQGSPVYLSRTSVVAAASALESAREERTPPSD